MKTIYCLGGSPQFRLPCFKYSFIIKEKEEKYKTLFPKTCHVIKDFYNIEEKQKESIVDQFMDSIYPLTSIKRCLQINPTLKLKMRKFYKHLRESLSIGRKKSNNKIKNDEKDDGLNTKYENIISINNEENKLQNLKLIFNRNNNKYRDSIKNEKKYINKFNNTYNFFQEKASTNQSRNKSKMNHTDLTRKFYNYNYPITTESNSIDFCQSLISKHKTKISTQLLSSNNNINNSLTNNSSGRIIFNSKFLNNFENNINENSKSQIKNNNINQLNNDLLKENNVLIKSKKMKYSSSIKNLIYKKKRKSGLVQLNKLNLIYSENDEQFYRKYDKYRKNKFLRGLCLTHINSSPKVVLNELNQKINVIKNKVNIVKSIVDKTFPKVLADISSIKKKHKNSQGKEGYNSPYIEKLNKIKREQENINSFISHPIKILSRNKNSN